MRLINLQEEGLPARLERLYNKDMDGLITPDHIKDLFKGGLIHTTGSKAKR